MSNYKDITNEYYVMAMRDLSSGSKPEELFELIDEYERLELYEACAGIARAIDSYKFIGDYYKVRDEDKTDLISINFEKDED